MNEYGARESGREPFLVHGTYCFELSDLQKQSDTKTLKKLMKIFLFAAAYDSP